MKIRYDGLPVDFAVTAEQMGSLDRRAFEECGIPSIVLMENAGLAVFRAATELLGGDPHNYVTVVCGPGNNGGDGFVVARHLHNAGACVRILYMGERERAKGDALTNLEIAGKTGLAIECSPPVEDLGSLMRGNLVIDALLGTGIKGDVREPYRSAISAINGFDGPVLAIDIPSGLDADTGSVSVEAVVADLTVTFALPKIGLLTGDGPRYAGDIIVASISIPDTLQEAADLHTYILDNWLAVQGVPDRKPTDHKGTYGHVAIIAGSVGMTGAATLAAEGALRIGTGLVTVAVPESLNDIMEVKLTEAMTIPVPEGKARAFGMASLRKVLEIIEKRDAAVIGPGFGRDDDTMAFTLALIGKLEKPAIIDADALYTISKDPSVLKKCQAPLILTPHPGEMATLVGTTVAEVQSNRLEIAREFAKEHGVTVVLKGAGTVIAEPAGDAYINITGTPGMATGGTGDVLSGMIGGLLAQQVEPVGAACSAVYLHGRAGEIAAEALGEAAMLASDVVDAIGDAIQEVTCD